MANVKISALPAATSVAAADTLPIVQSATTKKATFQNVIDAVGTLSPADSFKNVIINGDFRINQRGFTSTTTNGAFGHDRWLFGASDGTVTYSTQAFTLGNAITGQESANYAQIVTTGQTAASAEAEIQQRIESVRTFAGQQVTVSFWAKATSGTPKVAVDLTQFFGTGGSPSAQVNTYAGQVTLSTSWARYSVTVTVPSISGKTLGTAGDDCLRLLLWVSAGSSYNTRTGTLGIQTNTFQFWGVQVEAGANATTFERRPIGAELALCQRYYYRANSTSGAYNVFAYGYADGTTTALIAMPVPSYMRSMPTSAEFANLGFQDSGGSLYTFTTISMGSGGSTGANNNMTFQLGGASGMTQHRPGRLLANNSTSAYIGFSAEL